MFLNLLISRNVPRDPGSQDPSFLRVCIPIRQLVDVLEDLLLKDIKVMIYSSNHLEYLEHPDDLILQNVFPI